MRGRRTRTAVIMRITIAPVMVTATVIVMAGEERFSREELAPLEPISHAALYRLATWLSPAYPVGGVAY
jgi:urease accessory protein